MQKNIAVKIENLSKQYRLGIVGTKTLRGDLQRFWWKATGKGDPTLTVGQENVLADNKQLTAKSENFVWALRDINLEVKKGEVLGIIGKNGAGKSTLLKILSRVTGPTTGKVQVNGRIASLLEVGTGFHPELTGKENIFLNGAILGMRKHEIKKKLDEIVDFAGVAKYIDTPVKRYSSGMRVRLGFAVAAFLEPEILVVDEVLAVGDAEFQKKAIGKMQDVTKEEGRTVLFVSHNMVSVKNLCQKTILLENGKINKTGDTESVIDFYLKNKIKQSFEKEWSDKESPGNENVKIIKAYIDPNDSILNMSSSFQINFVLKVKSEINNFGVTIHLLNEYDNIVFGSGSRAFFDAYKPGEYLIKTTIPSNLLNSGDYYINLMLTKNARAIYTEKEILAFNIHDDSERKGWHGKLAGVVRPKLTWNLYEV